MKRYAPGLVDAGASSVATFLAGVFAARILGLEELGAYALIFSAMMLATQIATQVVLVPVEARLVTIERSHRVAFLNSSLAAALPWSLVAAIVTASCGLLIPATVDGGWLIALTGAAAAFVSPLQDHVRRMLHLAGAHGRAASVSVTRASIVLIALLVGSAGGVAPEAIPFGALAAGDLLSMLVARVRAIESRRLPYRILEVARSGSWLLAGSLAAPAAAFLVSFVVTRLAGGEALGLAESARVAAQPVLVLAMGLSAVLGPEAMEAARDQDRPRARRATLSLASITLGLAVVYLATTMLPGSVNPLQWAIPRAFEIPGLVQLSILAAASNAVVFLRRSELVVLDRVRPMAWAESVAGGLRATVSLAAGPYGSWVVPAGFLVGGVARIGLFTWLAERDPRQGHRPSR